MASWADPVERDERARELEAARETVLDDLYASIVMTRADEVRRGDVLSTDGYVVTGIWLVPFPGYIMLECRGTGENADHSKTANFLPSHELPIWKGGS